MGTQTQFIGGDGNAYSVPLSNTLYRKTGNNAASVFIPICAGAAPAWRLEWTAIVAANPWNTRGLQSFSNFMAGVAKGKHTMTLYHFECIYLTNDR